MQRLIFSLLVTGSIFVPHASIAQHYGGQYYPPPPHRDGYQNHFGGDTVIYDGQVLTNNLPPNTDTCGWVRSQGLSCQYERWDSNTRTHYVRSIPIHIVPTLILNGGSNCLLFCEPVTSFQRRE